MAGDGPTVDAPDSRGLGTAILCALLFLLLLVLAGRKTAELLPQFASWVGGLGPWGPVAFVGGYLLATVAFVPAAVLSLAAGATFGLLEGTLLVFIGAVAGSTVAFLLARTVARRAVAKRVAGNRRFAAIDRAVAADGLRIVFLLRLSPVFPFGLLNYGLGLTQIGFRDYSLASLGMLPGTFLYVYLGKGIGSLAALAAGAKAEAGRGEWILLAAGLVATLVVTVLVTRAARRALKGVADA